MHIALIDNLEQFEQIGEVWDRTYEVDPQAHIFMSSSWLRGCFETSPTGWQILVASPSAASEPAGFCVVRSTSSFHSQRRTFHFGGSKLGDYTGFLCRPETATQAVRSFARHFQRHSGWRRVCLRDTMDSRLGDFVASFGGVRYAIHHNQPLACPYIKLPHSWEVYQQDHLGARTRENLRRQTRKIQQLPNFHITHVSMDRMNEDMNVLLTLWCKRWGPRPTEETDALRRIFRQCLGTGELWLDILWTGNIPLAALAGLWDRRKRTFSYYISGFNSDYHAFSPGRMVVAHSIKAAIEGGMETYDFLRGNEPYKYDFGAHDRFAQTVTITRRNVRSVLHRAGGKAWNFISSND